MFLHPFHNPALFLHLDLGYSETLQLLELHAPCNLSHRALHIHTEVLELCKGLWNGPETIQIEQPRRGHAPEMRRQVKKFYDLLRSDTHRLRLGRKGESSYTGRPTKVTRPLADLQECPKFVLRTWTKVGKRVTQNEVVKQP